MGLPVQGAPKSKAVQAAQTKHASYIEIISKLEIQVRVPALRLSETRDADLTTHQETSKREPPPGYEFVHIKKRDLTKMCKDISRAQEAMVFVVAVSSPVCRLV